MLLAGVVLARAGIALGGWIRASRWLVWVTVVRATVSLVLNLITPSAGERMIWAPAASRPRDSRSRSDWTNTRSSASSRAATIRSHKVGSLTRR